MGLGGISIPQLLIVLAIILLLFGTKRLRTLGSDLGGAIKGFRKSLNDDDTADNTTPPAAGGAAPPNATDQHTDQKP